MVRPARLRTPSETARATAIRAVRAQNAGMPGPWQSTGNRVIVANQLNGSTPPGRILVRLMSTTLWVPFACRLWPATKGGRGVSFRCLSRPLRLSVAAGAAVCQQHSHYLAGGVRCASGRCHKRSLLSPGPAQLHLR